MAIKKYLNWEHLTYNWNELPHNWEDIFTYIGGSPEYQQENPWDKPWNRPDWPQISESKKQEILKRFNKD